VLIRLHRDERGIVSLMTVATLLVFVMMLGSLLNVARATEDKVRRQMAADSAAYSGSLILARGMNACAFTNHLQAEILALTAYFREGRLRRAERMSYVVLDEWSRVRVVFRRSQFQKFLRLGDAIAIREPQEREVVRTFSELTAAKATTVLPVLEAILGNPTRESRRVSPLRNDLPPLHSQADSPVTATHQITRFQQAVVLSFPELAARIADEAARRNLLNPNDPMVGPLSGARGFLFEPEGILRLEGRPFVPTKQSARGTMEPNFSLPVFLPSAGTTPSGPGNRGQIVESARELRRSWATHYLRQWVYGRERDMEPFFRERPEEGGSEYAKMSAFVHLFNAFACGELDQLLDVEYFDTNLPVMLRPFGANESVPPANNVSNPTPTAPPITTTGVSDAIRSMHNDYTFFSVVSASPMRLSSGRMFRDPIAGSVVSFAQTSLFLPRPRFRCCPWSTQVTRVDPITHQIHSEWFDNYDSWPWEWNLYNQNWSVRLVPATHERIRDAMSGRMFDPDQQADRFTAPDVSSLPLNDFRTMVTH
jgi:hypothetical protein